MSSSHRAGVFNSSGIDWTPRASLARLRETPSSLQVGEGFLIEQWRLKQHREQRGIVARSDGSSGLSSLQKRKRELVHYQYVKNILKNPQNIRAISKFPQVTKETLTHTT